MQKLRLYKVLKVSIHLYCGTHVGGQENTHQRIFPYNIIENSPTSFPVTLFSLVQMTSNVVQRHVLWSYRPYQNLGQIDHNLHNHVFDYVICKPPIVRSLFKIWLWIVLSFNPFFVGPYIPFLPKIIVN